MIAVIGKGGHSRVIIDMIDSEHWNGLDSEIRDIELMNEANFVVAIGDNYSREQVAKRLGNLFFQTIIHPSAVIACDVNIGEGTVVMANAVVNSGCVIGKHCIINTGAILEHDSVMEDFSSLAPRVVTGGNVRIGLRSSIGLGAIIRNKVIIGYDTVIGAGSLVLDEIGSLKVAYGSPCKEIRNRTADEPYL